MESEKVLIHNDELIFFIGFSEDAQKEADAVYKLEYRVQKELQHLRLVNSPIPFTTVKFWKWDKDASSKIGGQRVLIVPEIKRAQVAVFVFKDHIGDVTWDEISQCRSANPPKMVLAFFPKNPSNMQKLSDQEYMCSWVEMLKKKQELSNEWMGNNSQSVRKCEDYNDIDSLSNIAMEQFKNILTEFAKNNIYDIQTAKKQNRNTNLARSSSADKIGWNCIDHEMLISYFKDCLLYDQFFESHANGNQTSIQQYLITSGLANYSSDGIFKLTEEGILFCCQREFIHREKYHVHVQINWQVNEKNGLEEIWGNILYLRQEITKRVGIFSSRSIGDPQIRTKSGGESVRYEYPRTAIIEALTNFIIHRDYLEDDFGRINITDDYIEFVNPGMSIISPDKLLKLEKPINPKYNRNVRIIEATNKARMNQRQGAGILRIRQLLSENGTLLNDGTIGLKMWNCKDSKRFNLRIYRQIFFPTIVEKKVLITDKIYQYLLWLYKECSLIDIRGLQILNNKSYRFDVETLYIRLHTFDCNGKSNQSPDIHSKKILLNEVVKKINTVIIGEPGSGKTTFLRYIATVLCKELLAEKSNNNKEKNGITLIPFLIRISDFSLYIMKKDMEDEQNVQKKENGLESIVNYIVNKSKLDKLELETDYIIQGIKNGDIILLLDGLDEAPKCIRNRISIMVEYIVKEYEECPIIVTSRPIGYEKEVLLSTFTHYTIAPLEESEINEFLKQWTNVLYKYDEKKINRHLEELKKAVYSNREIRRMASNPVMLTALTLLYWNDKRLPDQRSELYELVITWLLRARQENSNLIKNKDVRRRAHQKLAFYMQCCKGGRMRVINKKDACDAVAQLMPGDDPEEKKIAAEKFLESEEKDSGIIISRGNTIEFWHLTFQEYMAAREIASMSDENQYKFIFQSSVEALDNFEWYETLRLFVGILYTQGIDKVNLFFKNILDLITMETSKNNEIKERFVIKARRFGLIGTMIRDLNSFGYIISDDRYYTVCKDVMGIFEPKIAQEIDVKTRSVVADALGQAGDPRIVTDIKVNKDNNKVFVKVPAGEYTMGKSDKEVNKNSIKGIGINFDKKNQNYAHRVKLKCFCISKYLVTVSQYIIFIEDGGYNKEKYWKSGGCNKWISPLNWEEQTFFPNRPVVGVSWFEAMAFCSWANLKLPTEAQWEKAVRGPDRKYYTYPWGNEHPDSYHAHFSRTRIGHALPVGCFPSGHVIWNSEENLWLADMAGNVWEWCYDWYGNYPSSFVEEPIGPAEGNYRILRGGSWLSDFDYLDCTVRSSANPEQRNEDIGFRCVFPY